MIRDIGIDTKWRKTTTSCFFVSHCLNCNLCICIFYIFETGYNFVAKIEILGEKTKGQSKLLALLVSVADVSAGILFLHIIWASLRCSVKVAESPDLQRCCWVPLSCPQSNPWNYQVLSSWGNCSSRGQTQTSFYQDRAVFCKSTFGLWEETICWREQYAFFTLLLPKGCAQYLASEMTLWEDTSVHQCLRPYLHICVSILKPLAACRWDVSVST